MCGIAGAFALDGTLDPRFAAAIRPMTAALQHRGPDGDGFYRDEQVVLGHRRLAIIDRAGGDQPISNEDRTCWIVFNGEIYNHRDLRRELAGRGHRFKTQSDTEAIIHAYEEYGPACVEHLEGMFAFAIYDGAQRQLLLARDRLGKKPLFWSDFGGVLHFASEIKALKHSPLWDPAIDWTQLQGYLALGYILAPETIYRGVHKLEPAHWLRVAEGRVRTSQYWDVKAFDDYSGPEGSALREIDGEIDARVRERLESEVPLGAFLSGGIDSGLIVSYMAQAARTPVLTTSVGFGASGHNELGEAGLTAGRYATEHHAYVIEPRLSELADVLVDAYDEPFADSSSIPTFYVAREARRHVTVALSGDGGDETFGGYTFRYIPHALESRARGWIGSGAARRAVGWLGARWPRSRRLPRPLRLSTYLRNVAADPEAAYFADLCLAKGPEVRALLRLPDARAAAEEALFERVTAPYRRCPSKSAVQRAEYADLKIYLPNDVLVKVDRMSMQNSLEVRCPLLDRRLVELAFRLPQRLKQADRTGKYLLRAVAQSRLPEQVINGPKRGFTAPVESWVAGGSDVDIESELCSPNAQVRTLVDAKRLKQMFHQHRSGNRDWSYLLWAIWVLERWARKERVDSVPRHADSELVATPGRSGAHVR
jgi:asparagine synthase (glutamine-hydrolysing)